MKLNKLKIFSTLHGLIFDMHVYDFPGKTHLPFRIYSTSDEVPPQPYGIFLYFALSISLFSCIGARVCGLACSE